MVDFQNTSRLGSNSYKLSFRGQQVLSALQENWANKSKKQELMVRKLYNYQDTFHSNFECTFDKANEIRVSAPLRYALLEEDSVNIRPDGCNEQTTKHKQNPTVGSDTFENSLQNKDSRFEDRAVFNQHNSEVNRVEFHTVSQQVGTHLQSFYDKPTDLQKEIVSFKNKIVPHEKDVDSRHVTLETSVQEPNRIQQGTIKLSRPYKECFQLDYRCKEQTITDKVTAFLAGNTFSSGCNDTINSLNASFDLFGYDYDEDPMDLSPSECGSIIFSSIPNENNSSELRNTCPAPTLKNGSAIQSSRSRPTVPPHYSRQSFVTNPPSRPATNTPGSKSRSSRDIPSEIEIFKQPKVLRQDNQRKFPNNNNVQTVNRPTSHVFTSGKTKEQHKNFGVGLTPFPEIVSTKEFVHSKINRDTAGTKTLNDESSNYGSKVGHLQSTVEIRDSGPSTRGPTNLHVSYISIDKPMDTNQKSSSAENRCESVPGNDLITFGDKPSENLPQFDLISSIDDFFYDWVDSQELQCEIKKVNNRDKEDIDLTKEKSKVSNVRPTHATDNTMDIISDKNPGATFFHNANKSDAGQTKDTEMLPSKLPVFNDNDSERRKSNLNEEIKQKVSYHDSNISKNKFILKSGVNKINQKGKEYHSTEENEKYVNVELNTKFDNRDKNSCGVNPEEEKIPLTFTKEQQRNVEPETTCKTPVVPRNVLLMGGLTSPIIYKSSASKKKINKEDFQPPQLKQNTLPWKIIKQVPQSCKSNENVKTFSNQLPEEIQQTDPTYKNIRKSRSNEQNQGQGEFKRLKITSAEKSPIVYSKLKIPDMFLKNKPNTSVNFGSEVSTSHKKARFVPPLKNGCMQIETSKGFVESHWTLEHFDIIQLTDETSSILCDTISSSPVTEVGLAITYREGFSQLNLPNDKFKSNGVCRPLGLMVRIQYPSGTTFCHIGVSKKQWKNPDLPKLLLLQLLGKSAITMCYDAQALMLFLLDIFGFTNKEVCSQVALIDPLIGCWLLDPDHPPNSFTEALTCLGVNQESSQVNDKQSRFCQLLNLLSQLTARLEVKLVECSLWQLFTRVEMALVPIIAVMELRGICVDKKKFQEISSTLDRRIVYLTEEAYKAAGRPFQLNSTLQLRQILYDELKLDQKNRIIIKETEARGAKSTSEAMLKLLANLHPLPSLVLEYRHLNKLKSTYVDAMLQHIRGSSAIHTSWDLTSAATGRLTSNNPNLQAVPKQQVSSLHNEEKKQGPEFGPLSLRSPYIPREGSSLLAADFQQIELRLFAHLSEDPALISVFHKPGDIFLELANLWLGKCGHVVGPDDREKTKRIVYSVMYGAGPGKLSEFLQVSCDEANRIINSFVAMFPALRSFPRSLVSRCQRQGHLRSISGRRRMFPNISSPNRGIRAHSERQAINFVIQGSAADICKSAMLHTEHRLSSRSELDARLLLQIHDELVWDVPDSQLHLVKAVVQEAMNDSTGLYGLNKKVSVPLPVTISTGPNWGAMRP